MSSLPVWALVLAALVPLVLFVALRRLVPATGLQLADAPSLQRAARRTLVLKGGLALGLAVLVGVGAALLREPDDPVAQLLPGGETTIVVLDVSASVSDLVYHEIAETLSLLAARPDRSAQVGLVLFSDTAYQAIPPGAPASELGAYVRFFRPRTSPDELVVRTAGIGSTDERRQFSPTVSQGSLNFIMSPWFRKFSGGTYISTGLLAAREALETAGVRGRVLLVSDLDDSFTDQDALAHELAALGSSGVTVDVVALPPATVTTVKLFRTVLGDDTTVVRSSALRASGSAGRPQPPTLPVAFMAVAGLLALLLAVHELRYAPLLWARSARR